MPPRNPAVASLLAVILLVFLAGFAGVSLQWRNAEAARADEKGQRDRAEQSQRETANVLSVVESQKATVEGSLAKAEAAEEVGRQLQYTTDMQLAPFIWKDDRSTAEQMRMLLAKHMPDSNAAVPEARSTGL